MRNFETPFQNLDDRTERAENKEDVEKKAKEEKLEKIRADVEQWGDAAGRGIDEGIKETVIMFNALDLPTSESCEGHIERGIPVPWVGIEAPNQPEERFIGENAAFEKAAKKYSITLEEAKRAESEKAKEAYREAAIECSENGETEEHLKWREENEKLKKRTEALMEEFYKERTIEPSMKLETDEGAEGSFRIYSGKEDYEAAMRRIREGEERALSEEEKEVVSEKLVKYRQEMKDFTKFLKDKYFGSKAISN